MNGRHSIATCPTCGRTVPQLSAGRLATHLDSGAGVWCATGYRPRWVAQLTARAQQLWTRRASAGTTSA